MDTSTLTHKVGDAMSTSKDFVQDVAHNVAERAPDVGSTVNTVGKAAQTSAEKVSDVVSEIPGKVIDIATKLAAITPFYEEPKPKRPRWMLRLAILATVAGIGWWFATRRSNHYVDVTTETPTKQETGLTERRFAAAGV